MIAHCFLSHEIRFTMQMRADIVICCEDLCRIAFTTDVRVPGRWGCLVFDI